MEVLLLSNGITPDHMGGLQRYVRELAGALQRTGAAEVTVVARRRDEDLPLTEVAADGVRIVRFAGPDKRNPLYAAAYPYAATRAARAAIAARPRHVLHAHFALQAAPLALGRRPYAYTFHAPAHREIASERAGSYALAAPLERGLVGAARVLERRVVRRAARVVTLSDYMRDQVAALDPGAGSQTTVMPGGVDTTRCTPGAGVDHPWATDPGTFLLVTARRLVERTGVAALVNAMPTILRTIPSAKLAVIGSGPQREQIEHLISRHRLEDHVRLFGRVSDDDLVGWFRSARLVVLPTLELEGFGLATAAALACGTPVLGTPAGATPELLGPLSADLISRDTGSDAIADAITEIAGRPGALDELAARARARVHPEMGWDAIAQRHLQLYEQVGHVQRTNI